MFREDQWNTWIRRNGRKRNPVFLLTPTRELASQIAESFGAYGRPTGLKHAIVFGGHGFFVAPDSDCRPNGCLGIVRFLKAPSKTDFHRHRLHPFDGVGDQFFERHPHKGGDGRTRAAAATSPVSSSIAKRALSRSVTGSTSMQIPHPWDATARV
jgi:hypothetical protein